MEFRGVAAPCGFKGEEGAGCAGCSRRGLGGGWAVEEPVQRAVRSLLRGAVRG